jgi:hypothetical protein
MFLCNSIKISATFPFYNENSSVAQTDEEIKTVGGSSLGCPV